MENYEKKEKAGEGAHGVVYRAVAKKRREHENADVGAKRKIIQAPAEGTVVAIKKIRMKNNFEGLSIDAIREIKLLQELDHSSVIRAIDIFNHEQNINIVMPYLPLDLHDIISSDVVISAADIKRYMLMIIQGVEYCHSNWVLHRDIKPANLLVGEDGSMKLTDFGLAKSYGSPNRDLSHQACTLWYRAPELLFGAKSYGTGADMWSVGCIFGELMARKPMFPGDGEVHQLSVIFAILGTPQEQQWPGITELPQYTKFGPCAGIPFKQRFSAATPDALDLLARLLSYDPQKRITAREALQHPYFSSAPLPTEMHNLPKVTKQRH